MLRVMLRHVAYRCMAVRDTCQWRIAHAGHARGPGQCMQGNGSNAKSCKFVLCDGFDDASNCFYGDLT